MSSISFNNASISAPVVGKPHIAKPHICMRAGYWRVSRWVKGSRSLFYHAHYFVNMENYKVSARKDAGVANTVESLPLPALPTIASQAPLAANPLVLDQED